MGSFKSPGPVVLPPSSSLNSLVTPFASRALSMSVIIDDRDSVVVYSAVWVKGGAPWEYDQTTSSAEETGMTAKLYFQGGYSDGH